MHGFPPTHRKCLQTETAWSRVVTGENKGETFRHERVDLFPDELDSKSGAALESRGIAGRHIFV
jgi:hypothetical protein